MDNQKIIEFIQGELKFLSRDDLISIRDIVLNYHNNNIDCFTETNNGLMLPLYKYDIECLELIVKYIENEYDLLVAYRNYYCDSSMPGNVTTRFIG